MNIDSKFFYKNKRINHSTDCHEYVLIFSILFKASPQATAKE